MIGTFIPEARKSRPQRTIDEASDRQLSARKAVRFVARRRAASDRERGADAIWGHHIRSLLNAALRYKPESLYVRTVGRWTWCINGHNRAVALDPPADGPCGEPGALYAVLGRHIFILHDRQFIGYLNEMTAGFGVKGEGEGALRDMLVDFVTNGIVAVDELQLFDIRTGAKRDG